MTELRTRGLHCNPDPSLAGYPVRPAFATRSDDTSRLFIGDLAAVKNDELHVVRWDRGAIELTKGWHPFVLHYAQGPGSLDLDVLVGLPGQRLAPLPDLLLRRAVVKPPRKNGIGAETPDDAELQAPVPAKP